ncbi:MAG: ABC transporter [Betaproteobacteria bacterium]|nr:ABC transporter [Betaproteobacteria bacterium]
MSWDAIFDPLFFTPFLTGLLFSLVLPVLGMYLRLREEWLAALSFAQLAAAGSLAAAILEAPVLAGGLIVSGAAAAVKTWISRSGNNGYALLMIAGWGASILMLSNVPAADHLGHALFDGQLYFTGKEHLASMAVFLVVAAGALRWLSRPLLLERIFPDFFRANGRSPTRYHLAFDVLIATGLALATAAIGVMASFALVFVPTMIAYQLGGSWKRSMVIAAAASVVTYVVAFEVALVYDQPFGPVMVLAMGLAAALAWAVQRLFRPRIARDRSRGLT